MRHTATKTGNRGWLGSCYDTQLIRYLSTACACPSKEPRCAQSRAGKPPSITIRRIASRSVGVVQSLLADNPSAYLAELAADYERVRTLHANKKQIPIWPIAKARANEKGVPVSLDDL